MDFDGGYEFEEFEDAVEQAVRCSIIETQAKMELMSRRDRVEYMMKLVTWANEALLDLAAEAWGDGVRS